MYSCQYCAVTNRTRGKNADVKIITLSGSCSYSKSIFQKAQNYFPEKPGLFQRLIFSLIFTAIIFFTLSLFVIIHTFLIELRSVRS